MGEAVRVSSIDVTSVTFEVTASNYAGTRWEVSLSGIKVEAPSASAALSLLADALAGPPAPDPETEIIHVQIDPEAFTTGTQVIYATAANEAALRSPEGLRQVVETMAAARMSPEWIAGALWASSWMRGEVD